MANILREEQAWGTRLLVRPLSDLKYLQMEIAVEVSRGRPGRNPDIKTWFNGVPTQSPLPLTDISTWQIALKTIMAEARELAEEYKREAAAATKKAAKKAATKAATKAAKKAAKKK